MKKEETVTFTHQDANEEYDKKGNIICKDKLFSTIHKLNQNLGHYKKDLFLTWLFVALETLCEILIPFIMQYLIDEINVQNGLPNLTNVALWALLMLFLAVCGVVFGILAGYWAASCSSGLGHNLRKNMYYHIQDFSFYNIDKFSSSSIVTRMTTDVTNVQFAYQMTIRALLRAPMLMIFALIMSFISSWQLAFVFLAIIPFIGICLILLANKAHPYFIKIFRKYDDLNESVQENVSAIRVVKAYVREKYEKSRFTKASGNVYRMAVKAERIVSFNSPLMMLTVYSCILGISWLGAKMIVQSALTTGELMMLLAYCMSILMNLMMLSMVFVMLSMSVASAERVSEVLNETPDIVNPENPVYKVKDGSIVFDHVSFRYNKEGKKNVLNDIDLSIKEGETIGIIGGTGSAKSSLVNLISRLYDVSEGRLLVGGKDVREYDIETLRDEVSVVLQKNVLFSGTILDNLRWGDENATEEECKRACHLACADEFIDRMPDGYHTYIEQGGSNVSGGQKQRLCIARALLKKPKILILDDSTSAVDTATDAKIREAFAKEIPDTTKLIIAQRVSSIQSADRIIVMDNGEISGFDTHENLMKSNEIYRDVYESQTKGGGDFDENGGE